MDPDSRPTKRRRQEAIPEDSLINAILKNEYNRAIELIHNGADVNFVSQGTTALWEILKKYNYDLVGDYSFYRDTIITQLIKLLLEKGANMDVIVDDVGRTMLMRFIENYEGPKFLRAPTLLIRSGANYKIRNKYGESALSLAIDNHRDTHPDFVFIIRELIARIDIGDDINIVDDEGETILMKAASNSHGGSDIIRMLLDTNLINNIEATDNEGNTALMIAMLRGNYRSVMILIEAGANVNTIIDGGINVLNYALLNPGDLDIVLELLERPDIDVNSITEAGQTTLEIAIATSKVDVDSNLLQLDVIKNLIERGLNLDTVNAEGKTVLIYIAENSMELKTNTPPVRFNANIKYIAEITKLLLKNHADWELKDNAGNSFFDLAPPELIRLLPVDILKEDIIFPIKLLRGESKPNENISKMLRYHQSYLDKLRIPPRRDGSKKKRKTLKKSINKKKNSRRRR